MLMFRSFQRPERWLLLSFLLIAASVFLLPETEVLAQANDATAFSAQRFRPWHDPNGMYNTESGTTLGKFKYSFGFMLNYAKDPLILRSQEGLRLPEGNELINNQFAADLTFGFGILSWLDAYIAIPMTLYQTGKIPADRTDIFSNDAGKSTDGFYLGDIQLMLKAGFLNEKNHGISLGLKVAVSFPTNIGHEKKYFNGEDGVALDVKLLFSKELGKLVNLGINVGYRYMPRSKFVSLTLEHELNYALGLTFHIARPFDLIAEASGSTSLEDISIHTAPFDLHIGGRIYPMSNSKDLAINIGFGLPFYPGYGSPQFRIFAGIMWAPRDQDTDKDGLMDNVDKCPKVFGPKENQGCPWGDKDGDGLKDNVDKCPEKPGPKENQGCPWGDKDGDGLTDNIDKCPEKPGPKANNGCPWGDRDGDGLKDNVDKCPDKPGPKENNGCPWPDTDKDGILDKDDDCPQKPGLKKFKGCPDSDKDGISDKDDKCPYVPGVPERQGCPKVVLVKVTKKAIQILKKIFFRTGSAKIRRKSFSVLNQVAEVLKNYPAVRVRVEGHTDNVGSKKYNTGLSRRRAQSVRRYLITKGIDAGRLEAEGYGFDRELVPNTSRKNRAKNRRVEFNIITKQDNVQGTTP